MRSLRTYLYLNLGNGGGGVIQDDIAGPWATAAYLLLVNFLVLFYGRR